jgi:hypothetical protein
MEPGVFRIPLVLPPPLEAERPALDDALAAAQRRMRDFAPGNGWGQHVREPFAVRAEIFDTQDGFIAGLLANTGIAGPVELPREVSAALENGVLQAVSPQVYHDIYPEGREQRAFEKLLAHEMAHRLHVRILGGDEEAMGPVWFFEGFALAAADQFPDALAAPDEAWSIIGQTQRGSYRNYAAVMRLFLERASLADMVARAGKPGFTDWLRSL